MLGESFSEWEIFYRTVRHFRHRLTRQSAIRQGERSVHVFKVSAAHVVGLSVWQTLQAFGTFSASVFAGLTNLNVWLRTFTSPSVCAIFGM